MLKYTNLPLVQANPTPSIELFSYLQTILEQEISQTEPESFLYRNCHLK